MKDREDEWLLRMPSYALEQMAQDRCLEIYGDFNDEEIKGYPFSIQIAWRVGRALSKLSEKENKA